MSALLEVVGVTKSFESGESTLDVLRGVDMEVAAGETVAIVGPSGCGKSTLLNIIGGLETPSKGLVRIEGTTLGGLSADELADVRNERIGYVFQAHHLLPQCTALENVLVPTLAGRLDAAARQRARDRAAELLDAVGLGDRTHHRPARLSGGECQRVAVVRALVNEPKLVLADEPTGALDEATAGDLAELLCSLEERWSTSLITVTHSRELAGMMQRTLRLEGGRLADA